MTAHSINTRRIIAAKCKVGTDHYDTVAMASLLLKTSRGNSPHFANILVLISCDAS